MSTPLTDSINALTTYANEVTGASDTNLSDAVHTLASGYGQSGVNYLNYAKNYAGMFESAKGLPNRIEFDASNVKNAHVFSRLLFQAYALDGSDANPTIDVIIHFPTNKTVRTSLYHAFFQAYGVRSVTIDGDLSGIDWYSGMFSYCSKIEEINVVFDFTSCSVQNQVNIMDYAVNTKVTRLRFVQDTLAFSIELSSLRALDADSLVSLANCLRADVTGQTLTLYSTQLSLCSSTMGNNDNGTFVADANGTMTLADFITNIKGWTLA